MLLLSVITISAAAMYQGAELSPDRQEALSPVPDDVLLKSILHKRVTLHSVDGKVTSTEGFESGGRYFGGGSFMLSLGKYFVRNSSICIYDHGVNSYSCRRVVRDQIGRLYYEVNWPRLMRLRMTITK